MAVAAVAVAVAVAAAGVAAETSYQLPLIGAGLVEAVALVATVAEEGLERAATTPNARSR
ncbi:hypothetical protein GCM10010245_91880 [Streptomyces spectabilis]|nr:hypothetical protein GCM10010245_91880 [Streptomyces spectabilis]